MREHRHHAAESAVMKPVPLVGREQELKGITETLERLHHGEGGTLLIQGLPGIGKTRLVETAIELAAERGIEVAHATADPSGTRRPFHVALNVAAGLAASDDITPSPDESLRELLESTRRAVDPATPIVPGSARVHVIEAIITELEQRARSPLMIIVDDLHFADDASMAALRAVLPLCAESALLVVATGRPFAGSEVERRLRDDFARTGTVIGLEALDPAEVSTLAGHLLAAPPATDLCEVLVATAGNPLHVTELVRSLEAEGSLRDEDGRVSVEPQLRHRARDELINLRLATLDDSVTAVLRCAAVLGHPSTLDELAAVAGRRPIKMVEDLEAAIDSGTLVDDRGRIRFAHDLLRDAVYDRIPPSTRSASHREAARILAEQGAPPVLVARHAALGSSRDEAVRWLRMAADDVMALAPETALEMLDEARALTTNDTAVDHAIQRARVESLLGVGRLDEATQLGEFLCHSMAPGDARSELLIRLGGMLVLANRAEEAVEPLTTAAAEAQRPGLRALANAQHALARIAVADPTGAETLARDAVALGDAVGETAACVMAESVLARIPCSSHRYREGLAHAERAVAIAENDPAGAGHDFLPWFWLGVVALDLDDHTKVEHTIRNGRARAAERHSTWAEPLFCGLAASLHHRRGALDEAAAEAESGVSLSADTGSTQALVWCQSIAALVADRRGEFEARGEWISQAEKTWADSGALLGVDHFSVAGSLVLDRGDAAARLAGAWDLLAAMGMHNCLPLLAVPLARAFRGEDPAREEASARTIEEAAGTGTPGLVAVALHIRGIVDGNIDSLLDAAAHFSALGRRLDRAEALADATWVAHRDRDPRHADLHHQAELAFRECDGHGTAHLLDPGTEPAPRSAPADEWKALTATERAVATLVASGRTNGEIAAARHVSRRTIESHLVRVYSKLGYSSRTRLAVEAGNRLTNENTTLD